MVLCDPCNRVYMCSHAYLECAVRGGLVDVPPRDGPFHQLLYSEWVAAPWEWVWPSVPWLAIDSRPLWTQTKTRQSSSHSFAHCKRKNRLTEWLGLELYCIRVVLTQKLGGVHLAGAGFWESLQCPGGHCKASEEYPHSSWMTEMKLKHTCTCSLIITRKASLVKTIRVA